MSVLEMTEVSVGFDTEDGLVRAVKGMSLSLDQAEILALCGESGCGKTVTAMSIPRLLPAETTRLSGSIVLDGRELTALSDKEMRDVPQRLNDQRLHPRHVGGPLDPPVPGERADPYPGGVGGDRVERADPVDVDDHGGRGEPHVEQRDEALPARQHLPIGPGRGQRIERRRDGLRSLVRERSRFHCVPRAALGAL